MFKHVSYMLLFGKSGIKWRSRIIGIKLMGTIHTFGNRLAWLLLLPGDSACRTMGLNEGERGELIRMLINSLVWTIVGVAVVSVVV